MCEQVDETSVVHCGVSPEDSGAAPNTTDEPDVEADRADGAEPSGDDDPEQEPQADLVTVVAELADQVRAHHARAEAREKVIDNLHDEVQRLRVGEQGLLLRPVVTDLQSLRGDLLRQAATLPADIGGDRVSSLLASFALSVEQALERCGVVPVRPEVGTSFSAREHRAVKVVEAASSEEDSTISAVVSDGYLDTRADRVTVPARVHVRKWMVDAESVAVQGGSGQDA